MHSVFANGRLKPCPAPFNLAQYVLSRAPALNNKTALAIVARDDALSLSYGELHDTVARKAGGLNALGLESDARVLLRLGNTVEFPLAFLACIWAGLIPVPTSSQLTKREVSDLYATISPDLIIAGHGIALPENASCATLDTADFAALADHPPMEPVQGDPERLGYIVFTSGTSGKPQAVMHAHRAIWARRMMFDGWYGLAETDRVMHAGAFNWTYTLGTGLLDPWAAGATALIPEAGTNAQDLPALLKRHEATLFAAAPGVFRQMLRADFPALPNLRHALSAGETLPTVTGENWTRVTGTPVYEAFGMSECSTFISGSPDRPAPAGACGYPQNGRRVAILGEDNAPVPRGTPGMIGIGCDDQGLTLGYLGAPGAMRTRFSADGQWFLTGDMGMMGTDGAVTYLGRGDDMMNAGGYRVSPLEVEAALLQHPEIAEAACAEVAVKADATVIAAFYAGPRALSADALDTFASARLARYKCPKIYIHRETLPRSANGKLLRKDLRRRYEAENDRS